jgi:hypothetical protein
MKFNHSGNLLVLTTVGSLTIPVSLTVALNNMTGSTGNGDVVTGNDNRIKIIIIGISECLP